MDCRLFGSPARARVNDESWRVAPWSETQQQQVYACSSALWAPSHSAGDARLDCQLGSQTSTGHVDARVQTGSWLGRADHSHGRWSTVDALVLFGWACLGAWQEVPGLINVAVGVSLPMTSTETSTERGLRKLRDKVKPPRVHHRDKVESTKPITRGDSKKPGWEPRGVLDSPLTTALRAWSLPT